MPHVHMHVCFLVRCTYCMTVRIWVRAAHEVYFLTKLSQLKYPLKELNLKFAHCEKSIMTGQAYLKNEIPKNQFFSKLSIFTIGLIITNLLEIKIHFFLIIYLYIKVTR